MAQIDLEAIAHNVRLVKHYAGQTKMMAVVKADAYGHGAVQVAKTALANGAVWLAVATAEEADELKKAGLSAPILVLGALDEEDCESCVREGISVSASTPEQVHWLQNAAAKAGVRAKAHLKIDSGFHRLGATPEQVPEMLEAFKAVRMWKWKACLPFCGGG
ncbi:MAG: alanine racemase [Christensenellales bacterium]